MLVRFGCDGGLLTQGQIDVTTDTHLTVTLRHVESPFA